MPVFLPKGMHGAFRAKRHMHHRAWRQGACSDPPRRTARGAACRFPAARAACARIPHRQNNPRQTQSSAAIRRFRKNPPGRTSAARPARAKRAVCRPFPARRPPARTPARRKVFFPPRASATCGARPVASATRTPALFSARSVSRVRALTALRPAGSRVPSISQITAPICKRHSPSGMALPAARRAPVLFIVPKNRRPAKAERQGHGCRHARRSASARQNPLPACALQGIRGPAPPTACKGQFCFDGDFLCWFPASPLCPLPATGGLCRPLRCFSVQ